jgi:hypothetical protein
MTLGHGVRSSCRSQRDLLCSDTAHWPSLAKRQDAACRCVLEERCPQMPVSLPTGRCGDLTPATPAAANHLRQGSAGLASLRGDPRRRSYFDSIALSRGAVSLLIGGRNCCLCKNLRVATSSSPAVVVILIANTIVRRLYRLW